MEKNNIELTYAEKEAKKFFLRLIFEGADFTCDIGKASDIDDKHPVWFDEVKFKRGQKFFKDNQFGVMTSNFFGLLTLLSEPKGLLILSSTGKSSTVETAKKRYVSTILSMMSWYEMELTKGSKSWISLNRVRRLHLYASNAAKQRNQATISQSEVAITAFGFMGFALIKPHLLGITNNNKEDREGFVHFWAVMCYMLGVKDEYNFCLNELEIVEVICHICLRYLFMPLLQIETPEFKHMASVLIEGMSHFLHDISYESQMFMTKRIAGVPGYQYDVDLSKEKIIKLIFTTEELAMIHKKIYEIYNISTNFVFTEDIQIINIKKGDDCFEAVDGNIEDLLDNMDNNRNINGYYKKINEDDENKTDFIREKLGLKPQDEIIVQSLDEEGWKKNLNDSKFNSLSSKDKFFVRSRCMQLRLCEYTIGNYICIKGVAGILFLMKRWQKKNQNKIM